MTAFPFLAATWGEWLTAELLSGVLRFSLTLIIGLPLLFLLTRAVGRLLTKHISAHAGSIISKGIFYAGMVILILTGLRELGFELTAILGAAGIFGVAIGFASQTSLSNIISGLFLVWEKPFLIGDAIKVGDTVGSVHSIDLLSIKLRTFDNRFIRIPHETLIKNEVTNITRFPIRRHDIQVGVAYKEDVPKVIRVLKEIADKNPHCLDEPEPVIVFQDFGDSSLNFLFGVWFAKADFLVLRNSIMAEIKERFDAEGIEIPFPHRSLYTGSVTDPFPIKIVGEGFSTEAAPPPPAPSPAAQEPASR
jgi:small-conductance mechanosensitive channel